MAELRIGQDGRTGRVGIGTTLVFNLRKGCLYMQERPGGEFFRWRGGMEGDEAQPLLAGFPSTEEACKWLATIIAFSHGLMALRSGDGECGPMYTLKEPRY